MATVLLAGAAVWLLGQLWPILLVVVVALILVGTLTPAVERLQARGVGRGLAMGLTFGALFLGACLLALLLVPALFDQFTRLTEAAPTFRLKMISSMGRHSLTAPWAAQVAALELSTVLEGGGARSALGFSVKLIVGIAYGMTSLVLALYLMADSERMKGALFSLVPRHYHLRLARVLMNLETIVGGYMRGQVITSAGMFAVVFAVLAVCRVPNALGLAVLAGLVDGIPLIGTLICLVAPAAAALTIGPTTALVVLATVLVYQQIERQLIVPRVYGRILRLPGSVIVVSLMIGAALLGVLGALLALPVAAGIRMAIEELRLELPGDESASAEVRERDAEAELDYAARTAGSPASAAALVAGEFAERDAA